MGPIRSPSCATAVAERRKCGDRDELAPYIVVGSAIVVGIVVCTALAEWRDPGCTKRRLRVIWEGDAEGWRQAKNFEYVERTRMTLDELEEDISGSERDAREIVLSAREKGGVRGQDKMSTSAASATATKASDTLVRRKALLSQRLVQLTGRVNQASDFLDAIPVLQGDEVVRDARRLQIERIDPMEARIGRMTGMLLKKMDRAVAPV